MTAAQRRVLLLSSVAVFVVFLDTTVVNIAFDTIGRDLRAGLATLVWVLTAYTVVFAAVLIPAGRLADTYGRRFLFRLGLVGFGVTSGLCGLAPGVELLIAARVGQAAFGAIVVPASLALLLAAFPAERRGAAISIWGAMAAVATATGPTIGALLIEYASWRWVFLVNVPVCLVATWWARRLPADPAPTGPRAFPDPVGVLLAAAGPALLSFGVVYGPRLGWGDPLVVGPLLLGAALLLALRSRSRRVADPVVDPALWRIRSFRAANVTTLVFSITFFAFLLSGVLFLQAVWHYSVLQTALAACPSAVVTALVAPRAGPMAERWGHRRIFAVGAACYTAGIAYLALGTTSDPAWVTRWLPALVLNGVGVGLCLSSLNSATALSLPDERFGVGSALNNSFRQFGGVLGVSVLAAILGASTPASALGDFHRAWWVLAAVPVVSAVYYLLTRDTPAGDRSYSGATCSVGPSTQP